MNEELKDKVQKLYDELIGFINSLDLKPSKKKLLIDEIDDLITEIILERD